MTRRNMAQKKGGTMNWPRQIGIRARAKMTRFVESCGRKLSIKGKNMQDSEINQAPLEGQETKAVLQEKKGEPSRGESQQQKKADLERAGATISAEKSMFCMAGLKIVGYVCDANGRHPDSAKILKILEWERCGDLTEARAFMGICGYYRIWVESYALIAEPIYRLLQKGQVFYWGREQAAAMEILKEALTTAPALVAISYEPGAGAIIAAFDASGRGWGAHLMQEDEQKRRHPARYESGLWSPSEMNYDAGKKECKALLKGLKKFRQYLYGVHFIVELDAKTLVAQLNRTASDLPGALLTRWIAWIRLFDFEVRHVPGKKNVVADGLSRKPPGPSDILEEEEQDIEDFIDGELDLVRVAPISACPRCIRARAYPVMTVEGVPEEREEDAGGDGEEDKIGAEEEEEKGPERGGWYSNKGKQ